jgi:hypothetical protein
MRVDAVHRSTFFSSLMCLWKLSCLKMNEELYACTCHFHISLHDWIFWNLS